jgi:hypothetical protein
MNFSGTYVFSFRLFLDVSISEVIKMKIGEELGKDQADMGIMGVEVTCTDYNRQSPWTYKGVATFVSSSEWEREMTATYNGKNKKVTYFFDDRPKEKTTFKWDSVLK